MNIYQHISSNARKTAVIVALFPLVLLVLVYATIWIYCAFNVSPESSLTVTQVANSLAVEMLPFVIGMAFLWLLVSFLSGDQIMLATAGATEISRQDNPQLYVLVENIAITAGLPMPRVFVIEDESANAFATGRNPDNSAVVFTTGILKILDKSELEGVVAHEMSHIGNRDVRLMMMVITGIGILTFLGHLLLRFSFLGRGSRRNSGAITLIFLLLGLVLLLYGVVLAPLIMYALSRSREYQADATAALLTRNPQGLASALEKISKDSRVEALDSMPLMSSACIATASGEGSAFVSGLFETHPPVEERIKALREMDSQRTAV